MHKCMIVLMPFYNCNLVRPDAYVKNGFAAYNVMLLIFFVQLQLGMVIINLEFDNECYEKL